MTRMLGKPKRNEQGPANDGTRPELGRSFDDSHVSAIKLDHANPMASWSGSAVRIRTGLNM